MSAAFVSSLQQNSRRLCSNFLRKIFEIRLLIKCPQSCFTWVQVPSYLELCHSLRDWTLLKTEHVPHSDQQVQQKVFLSTTTEEYCIYTVYICTCTVYILYTVLTGTGCKKRGPPPLLPARLSFLLLCQVVGLPQSHAHTLHVVCSIWS